jgi:hypothetical protein
MISRYAFRDLNTTIELNDTYFLKGKQEINPDDKPQDFKLVIYFIIIFI